MTILTARDLCTGYRHPRRADTVVTRELNLELRRGELVCLLGPNGIGKSTLMRTLAGMQPALGGVVLLDGQDIHALPPAMLARQMSIVLTERVDAGNLSVYELVALGRHPYTDWAGRLQPADHHAIERAIRAVGAEELVQRPVNELSDGERQKVMIGRALAQEPAIMLLDEPTAYLDLPRRVEIMSMLRTLARRTDSAILLSTHDLDLALRNADRIWLMAGDGTLRRGAPEDLVLSGAFARTFRSEGVEFDPQRGSFHMNRHPAGVVGLSGEGVSAMWTARALERAGFSVERPGRAAPVTVRIDETATLRRWQVTGAGRTEACASIDELVSLMRGWSDEM